MGLNVTEKLPILINQNLSIKGNFFFGGEGEEGMKGKRFSHNYRFSPGGGGPRTGSSPSKRLKKTSKTFSSPF